MHDVWAVTKATLRAYFSDLFIVKQEKHYKVADAPRTAAAKAGARDVRGDKFTDLLFEYRKYSVVVNSTSFIFTTETYKSTQINGLSITVTMSTIVFFNSQYFSLRLSLFLSLSPYLSFSTTGLREDTSFSRET